MSKHFIEVIAASNWDPMSVQMVEHGGFYRTSDQTWVKLERIQFVGACNPPTDPGRKPLTHRYSSQTEHLIRTVV